MSRVPLPLTIEQAQGVARSYVREFAPEKLEAIDAYHVWEMQYLPWVRDVLAKRIETDNLYCDEGKTALEVGPGWGTMALWLASRGWDVTVMDILAPDVFAPMGLYHDWRIGYAQADLSFAVVRSQRGVCRFDVVLCTQVLTHIKRGLTTAICGLSQMTSSSGLAVVSVADRDYYQYEQDKVAYDDPAQVPTIRDADVASTPLMTVTTFNRCQFMTLLERGYYMVECARPDDSISLIATCTNPHDRSM